MICVHFLKFSLVAISSVVFTSFQVIKVVDILIPYKNIIKGTHTHTVLPMRIIMP